MQVFKTVRIALKGNDQDANAITNALNLAEVETQYKLIHVHNDKDSNALIFIFAFTMESYVHDLAQMSNSMQSLLRDLHLDEGVINAAE